MTKYLKVLTIFFILISLSSTALFAYRPGTPSKCHFNQRDLQAKIDKYFFEQSITPKPIFPGKEFEDFYNILLEKKYFDKPLYHPQKSCSYGLTVINDYPIVYCAYHGNNINTDYFETMSARKYYASANDYGILIAMGGLILGLIISISRNAVKKAK